MIPRPSLPQRPSPLGCALVASLLAACSAKTVPLDHEPAGQVDGAAGSPNQDDYGLELVFANTSYAFVERLLVDDTRLYWQTDNGELRLQSCLKDNCAESVITYDGRIESVYSQAAFAISGETIYWLGAPFGTTIFACPKTGCSKQPTRIISDPALDTYTGLTAHNGDVYWLSSGDLYHCGAGGCGDVPQRLAVGEGALPLFMGSTAFWYSFLGEGRVRSAPDDGSSEPRTLVDGGIEGWAPTREYLYCLSSPTDVFRCPVAGCEQEREPFHSDPAGVWRAGFHDQMLRVSEDGVYWLQAPDDITSPRPKVLHYCPHSGCTDNTAAARKEEISDYAVDDDHIYLLTDVPSGGVRPGGFIYRVPKPR